MRKFLMMVLLVFALTGVKAFAEDALYSDIDTYINNYPISGYAVNGKMAVVAEDLRDYGFNVIWDAEARALHISRNTEVAELVRKDIYDPKFPSGTKYSDIYASDIKVDYNGKQMESYASEGYTFVTVNELAELAGKEEWNGETRTYKVWIEGLSQCDYVPLKQQCINLWYATDYRDMPNLSYSDDMDSDGITENIELKITGKDEYDSINASLKIGDAYISDITNASETWSIEAVYLVDLVPNDNAKEIAVYFMCYSGDPELYIYRYNNGTIKPMTFKRWESWDNKYIYDDVFYTGYVEAYIFDINDDGTFMLQEQTDSIGMWDVYVPYRINSEGIIERVYKDSYEVVYGSSYGENEWGFWYANTNLIGYGMPIYAGEWIRPVADDMNGNILIEKSNGTKGWIRRDSYSYGAFEECSMLFMMAG